MAKASQKTSGKQPSKTSRVIKKSSKLTEEEKLSFECSDSETEEQGYSILEHIIKTNGHGIDYSKIDKDVFPKLKHQNKSPADSAGILARINHSFSKMKEVDHEIETHKSVWTKDKVRMEQNKKGAHKSRINKDFHLYILTKSIEQLREEASSLAEERNSWMNRALAL